MITMDKQLLSGTHEDVRRKVEDLACGQDDRQYLAGTRFRELAVKLAMRDDLIVAAVTYDDAAAYELEVTLGDRDRPQPARRSLPDDAGTMAPHRGRTRH